MNFNFDTANKVEEPTLVLAYKSGEKIGALSNTSDMHIKESMNTPGISFRVNGSQTPYFDQISTFKLVWHKETDESYEASVESNQDADGEYKTVSLTRLGEAELSNINVYGLEVNTESDIAREDYEPTVLYNPEDEAHSLIHRILSHAPHYTVGHVDETIQNIQRTFSMNDKPVWDCFKEVAEEESVLFIPKNRVINVYDLLSTCNDCGYRGKFTKICPECGSTDITEGYGEDTGICVSKDALGNSITVMDNTDDMKNCLHLSGGDDDMTAAIRNCNPNGTGYMWAFTNETLSEMSPSLITKYSEYVQYYKDVMTDVIPFDAEDYNDLVDKYNASPYHGNFEKITTINGYPSLIKSWYDSVDFGLYLKTSLMPSIDNDDTTAQDVADTLTSAALSPVAIGNLQNISLSAASQAVVNAARLIANPHYEITIYSSDEFPKLTQYVWQGYLQVKNFYDDTGEDKAITQLLTITVNDDYESYVAQKVKKALYNYTEGNTGAAGMFAKSLDTVKTELKLYSLDELMNINQAFQGAVDILTEQKIDDPGRLSPEFVHLYEDMYLPLIAKKEAVEAEIAVRESEVDIINDTENALITIKNQIQTDLNLETYLGSTLWVELNAFRREESFSDDNFISDDLDSAELIARAYEFVQLAEQKLSERNKYSYQINSSLQNLLLIPEFAGLRNAFKIGNWIRVKTEDGELYKLRLTDCEMDYGTPETLSVTFSDVTNTSNIRTIQSIISRADDLIKNRRKYENENKKKFVALTDDAKADAVINNNITNDILLDSIDSANFNIIKAADEFEAEIKATEKELTTKFAQYSGVWIIPDGMVISYYGYGTDERPENPTLNSIYLDQTTGIPWKWNGTAWVALDALDKLTDILQSEIAQNAHDITLKVSETDYNGNTIASKINQNATTVQIEAEKVNLTGYVTVTDLSGSGTTTINGDNVTTGKIKSQNYSAGPDDEVSVSGTEIDLTNGTIKTPGVFINGETGEAEFDGIVYMEGGYIGNSPIVTEDGLQSIQLAHSAWKLESAAINPDEHQEQTEFYSVYILDGTTSMFTLTSEDKNKNMRYIQLDGVTLEEGYNYAVVKDYPTRGDVSVALYDFQFGHQQTAVVWFDTRYYTYLTANKNLVVSNDREGGHTEENDVTDLCQIGSLTFPWGAGYFKKLQIGFRDLNWGQIVRNLGLRLLSEPSDVRVRRDGRHVYISWKDPSNLTGEKPIKCKWAGTTLMRSDGQPAPWNRYQSTNKIRQLVEITKDNQERNYYDTHEFHDVISYGKRYFYGIFPYDTNGYTQFNTIIDVDAREDYETVRIMNIADMPGYGTSFSSVLYGTNHEETLTWAGTPCPTYIGMVNLGGDVPALLYGGYGAGYVEYPANAVAYAPADLNRRVTSYSASPNIAITSIIQLNDEYVTNISYMFSGLQGYTFTSQEKALISSLDLPGGGNNITDMSFAYDHFGGGWIEINYNNGEYINTPHNYTTFTPVCGPNVTNLYSTYQNSGASGSAVCGDNVVNMSFSYTNCPYITEAACGKNVTNMAYAFMGTNVSEVVCGDNVTNMYYAYANTKVTDGYYGPNVTYNDSGWSSYVFSGCNLEQIYWRNNLNGYQVYMIYQGCNGLGIEEAAPPPPSVTNFDYYPYALRYSYTTLGYIREAVCGDNVIDMYESYSGCPQLVNAACGNNVINMTWTYEYCYNLKHSACSNSVINMWQTYHYCYQLEDAIVGSNVKYMYQTYYQCNNLSQGVNLPNSLENIEGAFAYAYRLSSVYTSGHCDNLLDISRAFDCCYNLSYCELLYNNMNSVVNAYSAFYYTNVDTACFGPNMVEISLMYYGAHELMRRNLNMNLNYITGIDTSGYRTSNRMERVLPHCNSSSYSYQLNINVCSVDQAKQVAYGNFFMGSYLNDEAVPLWSSYDEWTKYDNRIEFNYDNKVIRIIHGDCPEITSIEEVSFGTATINFNISSSATLVYKQGSRPQSIDDGTQVQLSASDTSVTISGLSYLTYFMIKCGNKYSNIRTYEVSSLAGLYNAESEVVEPGDKLVSWEDLNIDLNTSNLPYALVDYPSANYLYAIVNDKDGRSFTIVFPDNDKQIKWAVFKQGNTGIYRFGGARDVEELLYLEVESIISTGAIQRCDKLKKLKILGFASTYNNNSIIDCPSLEEIEFTAFSEAYAGVINNCESLSSIVYPEDENAPAKLKVSGSFNNCPSLDLDNVLSDVYNSFEISDSFNDGTVSGDLIIPAKVTSISNAFKNNPQLTSVVFMNNKPTSFSGFSGCPNIEFMDFATNGTYYGYQSYSNFWRNGGYDLSVPIYYIGSSQFTVLGICLDYDGTGDFSTEINDYNFNFFEGFILPNFEEVHFGNSVWQVTITYAPHVKRIILDGDNVSCTRNGFQIIGNEYDTDYANAVFRGSNHERMRYANKNTDFSLVENELKYMDYNALNGVDKSEMEITFGPALIDFCNGYSGSTSPTPFNGLLKADFSRCVNLQPHSGISKPYETFKGIEILILPNSISWLTQQNIHDLMKNSSALKEITIPDSVLSDGGVFNTYMGDVYNDFRKITFGPGLKRITNYFGSMDIEELHLPDEFEDYTYSEFNHVQKLYYNGSAPGAPWGAQEWIHN